MKRCLRKAFRRASRDETNHDDEEEAVILRSEASVREAAAGGFTASISVSSSCPVLTLGSSFGDLDFISSDPDPSRRWSTVEEISPKTTQEVVAGPSSSTTAVVVEGNAMIDLEQQLEDADAIRRQRTIEEEEEQERDLDA